MKQNGLLVCISLLLIFSTPGLVLAAEPIADAGPDRTEVKNLPQSCILTLDGSGSTDPDGDPLNYQ